MKVKRYFYRRNTLTGALSIVLALSLLGGCGKEEISAVRERKTVTLWHYMPQTVSKEGLDGLVDFSDLKYYNDMQPLADVTDAIEKAEL